MKILKLCSILIYKTDAQRKNTSICECLPILCRSGREELDLRGLWNSLGVRLAPVWNGESLQSLCGRTMRQKGCALCILISSLCPSRSTPHGLHPALCPGGCLYGPIYPPAPLGDTGKSGEGGREERSQCTHSSSSFPAGSQLSVPLSLGPQCLSRALSRGQ